MENSGAVPKVESNGVYGTATEGVNGHSEPTKTSALVTSNGEAPEKNTTSSSIEVPVALLFGTQDSPDEYNIPGRQLEKLPPECLTKILEKGQALNAGTGLSVCRLGATESVESLLRVKQYLAHGDYLPFKPSVPLQIVDAAGSISEWSSLSTGADNVHTTDATFDLFVKEMKLYAFAADHCYTELREFSSEKLRTGYPVLAMETLALLEHLYILAEILQDQELLTFMKESSERHRDGLIRQPRFLTILRQSVGHHNPLGQVLLEVQIAASQQQQVELFLERQLIKPEPQAQPLSIVTQPTGGLLAQIHEVLIKERLVVAKRDGYGTLLGQPGGYVRNRDFTFEENELLLADYSKEPFNGRKNITVENAKGQRGDILGSLVWAVPAGLGTVQGSTHIGKPAPDRETRTFESPTTGYHGHYARSRSRSPTRRYM